MMNGFENKDCYYMGLALAKAKEGYALGEVPIGAIIVVEGEVVAGAHNMRETWRDATAHAEMIVIREACKKLKTWRLTKAAIYVTIEPCPMCAGALVMSRISRLVYGSLDYKAGAVESVFNITQNPALNHQLKVTSGIRSDECALLMREFFQSRRKTKSYGEVSELAEGARLEIE